MLVTRKSISTSIPIVSCDVCGRTLLRGEQPDVFLAGGTRRNVCELCTQRAAHEGWIREGLDDATVRSRAHNGRSRSFLARLRQLPFSELKIDRSYVSNCHIDRVNAGLCETIVELGQRFGLKTVAEGIETPHESHKLQAIGCHIGQGYLFAKPMPKAQLFGILRRRMSGHSIPAGGARAVGGG